MAYTIEQELMTVSASYNKIFTGSELKNAILQERLKNHWDLYLYEYKDPFIYEDSLISINKACDVLFDDETFPRRSTNYYRIHKALKNNVDLFTALGSVIYERSEEEIDFTEAVHGFNVAKNNYGISKASLVIMVIVFKQKKTTLHRLKKAFNLQ